MRDKVDFLINRADSQAFGCFRRVRIYRGTIEPDCARVARKNPRDDFDQCAFARAVFSHQRVNFPGPQREIHGLQRPDSGKTFRQAPNFQEGRCHERLVLPLR